MDEVTMKLDEFKQTFDLMLSDASAIAHNQQVLAGIHAELDRNLLNPFEQDRIYREHYGQFPAEPKEIEHQGVTIVSRVLHQTGARLTDIRAADLLYEIVGDKFVLIQYKRVADDRVRENPQQLESLLRNCPDRCPNRRRRPLSVRELPRKTFGFCGCWYGVMGATEETIYVLACEAKAIYHQREIPTVDLFRKMGVPRQTFMDLFSSCRVGALLRYPDELKTRRRYVEQLLEDKHLVFEVLQRGRWSSH